MFFAAAFSAVKNKRATFNQKTENKKNYLVVLWSNPCV